MFAVGLTLQHVEFGQHFAEELRELWWSDLVEDYCRRYCLIQPTQ